MAVTAGIGLSSKPTFTPTPSSMGMSPTGAMSAGTSTGSPITASGGGIGSDLQNFQNLISKIGGFTNTNIPVPQVPIPSIPYLSLQDIQAGLQKGLNLQTKANLADLQSYFNQSGQGQSTMAISAANAEKDRAQAEQAQIEQSLYNQALQTAQMQLQAGEFNASTALRASMFDVTSSLQAAGLDVNAITTDIGNQININSILQQSMQAFLEAVIGMTGGM